MFASFFDRLKMFGRIGGIVLIVLGSLWFQNCTGKEFSSGDRESITTRQTNGTGYTGKVSYVEHASPGTCSVGLVRSQIDVEFENSSPRLAHLVVQNCVAIHPEPGLALAIGTDFTFSSGFINVVYQGREFFPSEPLPPQLRETGPQPPSLNPTPPTVLVRWICGADAGRVELALESPDRQVWTGDLTLREGTFRVNGRVEGDRIRLALRDPLINPTPGGNFLELVLLTADVLPTMSYLLTTNFSTAAPAGTMTCQRLF